MNHLPMLTVLSTVLFAVAAGCGVAPPSSGGAGGTSTADGGAKPADAGSTSGEPTGTPVPGGGYNGAPIQIDNLYAVEAEEICKAQVKCGADAVSYLGFTSVDVCKSFLLADAPGTAMDPLITAVKNGKVSYDASAAGKCIQFITATCEAFPNTKSSDCQKTFIGNVGDGGACDNTDMCKSRYCQHKGGASCPGFCATRAKLGEPCPLGNECESGASCKKAVCVQESGCGTFCGTTKFCDKTQTPEVCKIKGKGGSLCADSSACESGDCKAGTCSEFIALGAACTGFAQPSCANGAVCAVPKGEAKGLCKVKGKLNQPCDNSQQCASLDLSCVGGLCALPAQKGATCAQDGPISCMPPLRCLAGKCGDAPGKGQACAVGATSCQKGLNCVKNICTDPPGPGEPCTGACKVGSTCQMASPTAGVCKAVVCEK